MTVTHGNERGDREIFAGSGTRLKLRAARPPGLSNKRLLVAFMCHSTFQPVSNRRLFKLEHSPFVGINRHGIVRLPGRELSGTPQKTKHKWQPPVRTDFGNDYDSHMIILILFLLLILGVSFILISLSAGFEETEQFPTYKLQPMKVHETDPDPALLFQQFCKKKCRYRHVCLTKRHARRDGNCYEFELSSNALW